MHDEVEQALKDHYRSHELPSSRVEEILEFCEPARQIVLWKRRALLGFTTAAAAIVALLAVVAARPAAVKVPQVADRQNRELAVDHDNQQVSNNGGMTLDDLQQPERFQLIAVKIHADPCGRCKKIAPVFADLQSEFSDDPVLFLTFDLTSESSRKQAEELSRAFGIEELFAKHRYTGVIVLATPDGQIWDVLDSDADVVLAEEVVSRNLISG